METLLSDIAKAYDAFKENATLNLEKGVKVAAQRARKNTLALEKLLKQYRKDSLAAGNEPATEEEA